MDFAMRPLKTNYLTSKTIYLCFYLLLWGGPYPSDQRFLSEVMWKNVHFCIVTVSYNTWWYSEIALSHHLCHMSELFNKFNEDPVEIMTGQPGFDVLLFRHPD